MADKDDVDMLAATTQTADPGGYVDLLQTPHSDAFAFADTEKRALELYDQLLELELQLALLQAQSEHSSDNLALSDDEVQEQLTLAEREAMDAKAEYEIRNRITHNVLVMDPVLKAVHGGEQTGYAEKRLLPMLAERDTVNMIHNNLSTKFVSLQRDISSAERGNITANSQNRELSATMLELAEEMKAQSAKDIQDPRLREQVASVEKDLKESRRRMKTLKGILSAMIVGSGINWAADEGLVELVMDDEDE